MKKLLFLLATLSISVNSVSAKSNVVDIGRFIFVAFLESPFEEDANTNLNFPLFLETTSIQDEGENTYKFIYFSLGTYKDPDREDQVFMASSELDCKNKRTRLITVSKASADGKYKGGEISDPKWEEVSDGYPFKRLICDKQYANEIGFRLPIGEFWNFARAFNILQTVAFQKHQMNNKDN